MDYSSSAPDFQGDGYSYVDESTYSDCVLQFLHDHRVVEPDTVKRSKPRKPKQSAQERKSLVAQAESALVTITDAQLRAGPSALAKIDAARRFSDAANIARDRNAMSKICLGQRNGVCRILQVLEQRDHILQRNDRVDEALDIILTLSANASALTGSGWPSTLKWLERNMPIITAIEAEWLESEFQRHLTRAQSILLQRLPIHLVDYRTAPSPTDIAHRLQITTHVLRVAKANTIGLTSVDPEPKRERDRRGSETRRRAKGETPQSERTKTVDDKQLAVDLGCGASTIRRHRKAGTLPAFIEKRRNEQLSSRG